MTNPFRLKDLSIVALSTQLQRLTGDSYNVHDFRNRDNNDELTANGVIVHKKTGLEFEIPNPEDEHKVLTHSRIDEILHEHKDQGMFSSLDKIMTEDEQWQLSRVMHAMPGNFNALNTLQYMRDRTAVDGTYVRDTVQSFTPEADTSLTEALKQNARIEFIDDVLNQKGVYIEGHGHHTIMNPTFTSGQAPHVKTGLIGDPSCDKVHDSNNYQSMLDAIAEIQRLRTSVNQSSIGDLRITPLSRVAKSDSDHPALIGQNVSIYITLPTNQKAIEIEIDNKNGFIGVDKAERTAILSDLSGIDNVLSSARSSYMEASERFNVIQNVLTVSESSVSLNSPSSNKEIFSVSHDGSLHDIRGAISEVERNAAQNDIDIHRVVNDTEHNNGDLFKSPQGARLG